MTITSSLGYAAAPAPSPDPAIAASGVGAVPGPEAEATSGFSLFSMMLSGMAELPEAVTELPPSSGGAHDAAPEDETIPAAEAATQAIIAALMPVIAAPVPVTPLKQPLAVTSVQAAAAAARPDAAQQDMATDSDALTSAWLVTATKDAASNAASDAAGDTADGSAQAPVGELIERPGLSAIASPAANFSPMQQVSQLGNAFTQINANALPQQPSLQHNVGTARWAEELGSKLTMMASQGQMSGSLTLSPEHLGPLHVQIDMKNDVTSVWFGSQHADTRAALNDALPRLREMFDASGLVLGDAGVSRDTPRQEAQAAEVRRFTHPSEDAVLSRPERQAVRMAHAGILDTYA
ncbi:MAG: flagellar hook-length control protein FliK [Pseudomonadota bacterium]